MPAVTKPRIQGVKYLLPGEYELLHELAPSNGGSLCPSEFSNGRSYQNNAANLQRLARRGLVTRSEHGWYILTIKGYELVCA